MPWFRCFARGENFPAPADGPDRPVGFYATQFVEATDPDGAEPIALSAIQNREILIALGNNPAAHRARVYFDEIEEVSADAVPDQQPGLVFFPMDESSPSAPAPKRSWWRRLFG